MQYSWIVLALIFGNVSFINDAVNAGPPGLAAASIRTQAKNIFENIPSKVPEEIFETIQKSGKMKIERIISKGQSSPKDFWYDQDQNEWVIVLKGRAGLRFQGKETVELKAGDYVNIPAHAKHRVEWTDKDRETIWLTVFY